MLLMNRWNGGARRASVLVVGIAMVASVAACSDDDDAGGAPTTAAAGGSTETTADGTATAAAGSTPDGVAPTSTLPQAPVSPVPPLLDEAKVSHAVDALDGIVGNIMDETGVPGIAVAVVYEDEVVFAKGYGVREVGKPETARGPTRSRPGTPTSSSPTRT
jgi:hypothetical protein